ncbi:Uncharacterised protein [Burkholderia pseudomallei]|nr:Uncharacterised protein [Burkholderia pseudomallei]
MRALAAHRRAVILRDERIDGRQHEQREQRADQHAGRHRDADREAARRAGARGEHERHEARDHRRGRHQDRTQPHGRRALDRRAPVEPFVALQIVREADHQDPVLRDQPDQRDEPDLRIDVERRETEVERGERAADRQRHRHQDHERIAQALELRGEHEEDHDQREAERDGEPVAFLHVLPRFAEPVDREAGGQLLRLEERHRVAHRHAGRGHRGERRRVHLVELAERVGLAAVGHLNHGRQRNHLPRARLHVIAAEHLGGQPLAARHLRDHVV